MKESTQPIYWSQVQYAKYRGVGTATVCLQINAGRSLPGVISVDTIAGKRLLNMDLKEVKKYEGKGGLKKRIGVKERPKTK